MTNLLRKFMTLLRVVTFGGTVLGGMGLPASADQIDMIVDRTGRGVEVFLGMSARTAVDRFGLAPERLRGADGTVDFAAFTVGTWDIGDDLLSGVGARIGGRDAGFEATSLMVHLKDQRLPFQTPLDALTAISVCGVDPPDTPPSIDELYLYAGFVAYPSDPEAQLMFDLPDAAGEALSVTVRSFGPADDSGPKVLPFGQDKPLVIGGKDGGLGWWSWLWPL